MAKALRKELRSENPLDAFLPVSISTLEEEQRQRSKVRVLLIGSVLGLLGVLGFVSSISQEKSLSVETLTKIQDYFDYADQLKKASQDSLLLSAQALDLSRDASEKGDVLYSKILAQRHLGATKGDLRALAKRVRAYESEAGRLKLQACRVSAQSRSAALSAQRNIIAGNFLLAKGSTDQALRFTALRAVEKARQALLSIQQALRPGFEDCPS